VITRRIFARAIVAKKNQTFLCLSLDLKKTQGNIEVKLSDFDRHLNGGNSDGHQEESHQEKG
jgi:predicted nucleotide-binding protein (sugar kinase/HSP70/actin superfamily)